MRSKIGTMTKPVSWLLASLSLATLPTATYAAGTEAAAGPSTGAAKKWNAVIPPVAENSDLWQKLIPALLKAKMPYGALAASRNMLNFFGDLPSKELAFTTIIELIDLGYPFTTRPYFVPGDIEPKPGSDFAKNYFFYKGVVNVDQKMARWAENHFAKLDKDAFPKFIFYKALNAYGEGKTDEAIQMTKKALSLTSGSMSSNLAQKEARTLARFYYERGQFDKSFEIYDTFLLKVNPMEPSDWLEAAWALYGLKRYPEALGHLYNLESKSAGSTVLLEKFILRALIYREFCAISKVANLNKDFEKEFGKTIDSIRLGEPLQPTPELIHIEHPETIEYRQALRSIERLTEEQKRIDTLPSEFAPLASFLYTSELKMMERMKKTKENEALQVLAKHLVILAESLKFLKFEVAREKYNPDVVFADSSTPTPLIEDGEGLSFRLRWKKQRFDFWRDERQSFSGEVKNQCEP